MAFSLCGCDAERADHGVAGIFVIQRGFAGPDTGCSRGAAEASSTAAAARSAKKSAAASGRLRSQASRSAMVRLYSGEAEDVHYARPIRLTLPGNARR